MKKGKDTFYARYVKRWLDVFFSLLALAVLGIPMLIVALLILLTMGSPVLFRQRRTGRGGREFKILKFRSMTNTRDGNGVFLPDSDRITRLGRFIRVTSIDELPSLFNIIKGEMSIIGPRPLPVRYLDRYTVEQARRLEVRPGLSAPSVVDGRNDQSWEKQFEGDVWYVDHVSFGVDAKSVLDTIRIVLTHKGATADDGENRAEFIGTADINALQTDDEGNYMKIRPGK